ncbi:MAG: hypothetical protein ACKV2T_25185 [Kofleriaceae bacterium]
MTRAKLALLLGAQVLVAACGADACVTPTTWCEAGTIMRCVSGAPMMETDCVALGEMIGVEKQCGTLKASEDRHCVDLRQTSCATAGATECAPGRRAQRTCVETDFGMIWDSQSIEMCTTGQVCQPTTMGEFVCITPPAKACAAAAQCDGMMLETCAGNPTDGYVVVSSMACPSRCEVRLDGTTACD